MAIVNRDLDSSQKVVNLTRSVQLDGAVNTVGLTHGVAVIPAPMQLVGAGVASIGLSGAPNLSLWLQRFVAGSGFTSINMGASMAAWDFGVSGGQTFNVAAGVTYPLQTGDQLVLCGAGSNLAARSVTVTLALKALQDIKSSFGVSV